jgi:uncharacterized protein involved in exopolysaccharide biosynthesis
MTTYSTRSSSAHGAYETDSLRAALRAIARSWWIVLLAAAIAAGAATVYSKSRPTTYKATTSLLFNDAAYQQAVAGGYNPVDAQRRLKTSADVLRLPAIAQRAKQALSKQPGYRPRGASVKPEFSLDSNTMKLVATAPDRRSAAMLANATANAFLAYRNQMGADSLKEARSVLKQQIAGANSRTERRLLVAKRNNLDAMKALDNRTIQVAQAASEPATPAMTGTKRNAIIAAVLGALVGIGIALLRVRPEPQPLHDPWIEEAERDRVSSRS